MWLKQLVAIPTFEFNVQKIYNILQTVKKSENNDKSTNLQNETPILHVIWLIYVGVG